MSEKINAAIVGFGLSGKVFHAPFLQTSPLFRLYTIVSSGTEAQSCYPAARVISSFDELLADPALELVVLCTPHHLHAGQAIRALEAGKHVVVEKPVAMSSAEMNQIMQAAQKSGKQIFPYHNRRWDGDFMTLRHLIAAGFIGEVLDFESHFDRYQPEVRRAEWRYVNENGGGTLFDLGPHLIDQAICLFGRPDAVWCRLYFQRPGSKANDSFDLKLFYHRTTATLRAGIFVMEPGPRFQVHGTLGSYIKYGLDTQEAALKKGKKPTAINFGSEPEKMHGLLHSVARKQSLREKFKTFSGRYMGFYENVYDVISGKDRPEVTSEDALLNLQIIEAALISHIEKRIINLTA
ncbi:MAG: Gfo/Idh/MocA family oxidoreductase [Bacteroidales bacterium]|nr:Gfo/Idh/MocA family oxidoreductase [Bacteroidales bacterium]